MGVCTLCSTGATTQDASYDQKVKDSRGILRVVIGLQKGI